MLFAELCAERGAEVWLMLPLPENDFLEESVRLPKSDWEDRYFDLSRRDRREDVLPTGSTQGCHPRVHRSSRATTCG